MKRSASCGTNSGAPGGPRRRVHARDDAAAARTELVMIEAIEATAMEAEARWRDGGEFRTEAQANPADGEPCGAARLRARGDRRA